MKLYLRFLCTLLGIFLLISSCRTTKKTSDLPSRSEKENDTPTLVNNDTITNYLADTALNNDIYDTEDSLSVDEISGDSLTLINRIINDTAFFAKHFKNTYGKNNPLEEDPCMLSGSRLLCQIDSLSQVHFYNKYIFNANRDALNVYNYDEDTRPQFNDSIIETRIAMLNIQTPVELVYNSHVKAMINMYANRGRKQTGRMLGLKEIYFPLFEEILDKHNMPLELKYLAVVESALNPTAGSRAGAKGLWQFMYGTGKLYGLKANSLVDDRFDPYKATEAAALLLKDLYNIYGTWELALAAYNSGGGNVNRAIRRAGGIKDYWAIWPFLPRETRGYVPAFIAVNYVFNYATEHNIFPTDPGILYYGIDSISVHDVLSFEQISEFMHIDMEDIKFLNPAYKQGIIPASASKPYILRLPREKIGYFIDHEQALYDFKSSKGIEREKLQAKIKAAKQRSIYIVRRGDNLGSIARKYRTSVSRIKAWNGMRSTRIYPGQRLIVYAPGGGRMASPYRSRANRNSNYHTIRKGENLGLIARKYGVSVKQIKRLNHLKSNVIKIGQRLQLRNTKTSNTNVQTTSGKGYKYHTVKQGDTLWELAKKYGTSVSKIKRWNKMGRSNNLKLGKRLIVGTK